MQLASLTIKEEKKNGNRYVIPPSFFKTDAKSSASSPEKNNGTPEKSVPPSKNENTFVEYSTSFSKDDIQKLTTNEQLTDVPKVVSTERPKISSQRKTNKISALSLKSIQKKQELKKQRIENLPNEENLPANDFNEEQMLSAWNEYTKKVESEGQYNLLSHLTMGIPKLEGSLIHLEFPNETIKVEVERAKFELLEFLRQTLQNYKIDISIEVNETIEKKYAYTPREKFEKLKEKNPLIEKLRKDFDLDI